MLSRAPAASAQQRTPDPSFPAQHRRGSSYQSFESNGGYQSPRQHQQLEYDSIASPSSTKRRENAFNAPRPSLLPYQEYHSGFADEDLRLESPYSCPSPTKHNRQQSLSNFLPLSLRSRTPSPVRKTTTGLDTTEEGDMPYTGDGRAGKGTDSPRSGLAGWLGSATGSIRGLPAGMEGGQMAGRESRQSTPNGTPRKNSVATATIGDPTTPRNSVSKTASRFMSAISTRLALPQTPSSPNPNPTLDDELCNLSIETALFPPGSPTDRDAFSPAAFKNLQLNATGILTRLQNAYRQKTVALRDLEAERAAEKDELEEAVTRATHLKMQLEGMASKAVEQQEAMRELMDQLMAEKRARAEEKLARERAAAGVILSPPEGSISEDYEDDGESRKLWRKSAGTDGSYSDEDSLDESVFSRSRSPTVAPSTVEGSIVDGPINTTPKATMLTVRGRNSGQMSTFQKIVRGVVGVEGEGVDGCRNCKGRDASVAWDTVSLLRDENKHLKQRVGQLEVAVEGALDLVNGLGI